MQPKGDEEGSQVLQKDYMLQQFFLCESHVEESVLMWPTAGGRTQKAQEKSLDTADRLSA